MCVTTTTSPGRVGSKNSSATAGESEAEPVAPSWKGKLKPCCCCGDLNVTRPRPRCCSRRCRFRCCSRCHRFCSLHLLPLRLYSTYQQHQQLLHQQLLQQQLLQQQLLQQQQQQQQHLRSRGAAPPPPPARRVDGESRAASSRPPTGRRQALTAWLPRRGRRSRTWRAGTPRRGSGSNPL